MPGGCILKKLISQAAGYSADNHGGVARRVETILYQVDYIVNREDMLLSLPFESKNNKFIYVTKNVDTKIRY
ncbi:hypothetical protein GCM10028825_15820 [Spirosoma agri]